MQFRIGVIGATGFIGTPYREQMREAKEDARIVALCARRRDLLEAAAEQDGAEFITHDWREVVEHPAVNLVLVAVPDALHHEMTLACAANGKHVICEKPVAINARQAYEMWSAYRDTQLGHFVPFWSRHIEVFRRARQVLSEGTLGDLRVVIYRWHNPRPVTMPFTWRDNAELSTAGSIADGGSHAYDAVRWMTGLEATRALAHAGVVTPPKPDLGTPNLTEALAWGEAHVATGTGGASVRKGTAFDYGCVAVEYDNGAVGFFVMSHAPFLRKGLAPELELHGTEASLGIDRWNGVLRLERPGAEPETLATISDPGPGNQFVQHVFPGIRARMAGRPTEEPGLDDGWRVQLFTDAATASAQRGSWVETAAVEAEATAG